MRPTDNPLMLIESICITMERNKKGTLNVPNRVPSFILFRPIFLRSPLRKPRRN